jgi:hypothetical protein
MSAPASRHVDWERDLAAALTDIASRPGRLTTPASDDTNAGLERPAEAGRTPSEVRQ